MTQLPTDPTKPASTPAPASAGSHASPAGTPDQPATQSSDGVTPAARQLLTRERRHAVRRRRRRRSMVLLTQLGLVVGIVVLWEAVSGTLLRPFFISSPEAVGERLFAWLRGEDDFWFHAQFTLTSAGLGFLVGAAAAVVLAWPLALRRATYRVVEPYFLVAYSIPAVALGPVFILWFGIGLLPKVLLAAYFVFFVVFINSVEGVRQVPQGLLDVTRVMGASRWETMRQVMLPSALPYLLAAFRATLPASMIGAVVGEFIASNRGIGFLTREAAGHYQTSGVIGGTIVLASIVLLLSVALRPLSRALRWQPDVRLRGGGTS